MQGSFRPRSRTEELRAYAPSSESSAEDFLFHLYRGNELLQDDRVHQAKEELEAALRLQPRDPKGQDLLAVVYFRLGLYPRAIEIYEELVRAFPKDASLGNNLALCYLKTGQSEKARSILEALVMHQPEHTRAWAYLGLAYERLGDYRKAKEAFERGQATGMARRMAERLEERTREAMGFALDPDEAQAPTEGFEELDDREVSTSIVPSPLAEVAPSAPKTNLPPALSAPPIGPQSLYAAPPADGLLRSLALPPPSSDLPLGTTASGAVAVQLDGSFALRIDAIRAWVSDGSAHVFETLLRRGEGEGSEKALGGPIAPIVLLRGRGQLLVGARGELRLVPMLLTDEPLVVRESALVGFEGTLAHDTHPIVGNQGAPMHLVALRGKGGVVLEASSGLATIEIEGEARALVHKDALFGWFGSLDARALSPAEAPLRTQGLLEVSGHGLLLVTSRKGGFPS